MADLGRLVMRSGAPQLRLRIAAALVLVFVGKAAGVIAPVMLGDAINTLRPPSPRRRDDRRDLRRRWPWPSRACGSSRPARPMPATRSSPGSRSRPWPRRRWRPSRTRCGLSLDFHQSKQTGTLTRIIDRGSRSTDFLIRSLIFSLGPTAVELVMAMVVMVVRLNWRFAVTALVDHGASTSWSPSGSPTGGCRTGAS